MTPVVCCIPSMQYHTNIHVRQQPASCFDDPQDEVRQHGTEHPYGPGESGLSFFDLAIGQWPRLRFEEQLGEA